MKLRLPFYTMQQRALKLQESGLKVEQWGKKLQEYNDQLASEYGELIEAHGKVIQLKAEEALAYTLVALEQEDISPSLTMLIAQTHSEAREAFMHVIGIYIQMIKIRIKQIGENL